MIKYLIDREIIMTPSIAELKESKRSKAGREKYGGTPIPGTASSLPAGKRKKLMLKDLDYIINDVDDLSESLRHLRDRIEGLK